MTSSLMGYSGSRGAAGSNLRGNTAGGGFGGTGGSMGQRMSGDIIPKGYKLGQLQQFTPEQQGLFQQLFGYLGQGSKLSGLASGDEDAFNQIEAPAMRQFQGLIGQNASRFSGAGLGARRGSGFQNSTGQITSDFAQDLASKRQGLQRQALLDLMGLSSSLLGQRPYERSLFEKPQKKLSFLQQLGLGLSGGIGEGIGSGISALAGGF